MTTEGCLLPILSSVALEWRLGHPVFTGFSSVKHKASSSLPTGNTLPAHLRWNGGVKWSHLKPCSSAAATQEEECPHSSHLRPFMSTHDGVRARAEAHVRQQENLGFMPKWQQGQQPTIQTPYIFLNYAPLQAPLVAAGNGPERARHPNVIVASQAAYKQTIQAAHGQPAQKTPKQKEARALEWPGRRRLNDSKATVLRSLGAPKIGSSPNLSPLSLNHKGGNEYSTNIRIENESELAEAVSRKETLRLKVDSDGILNFNRNIRDDR